ncbi:MAG: Polysaccharide biosynthesis protein [Candidatus Beckwithbacteria bacterium GW2011_GWB1_47_15]|uniref:Polysaccharide biosynthesis protein n=1 Tax=Candidatus Beckwithbacteria bacterium GW2011_GWB1_47_15 TaxID=1618371 RepID=A0A0G1RV67_9BACT|nr:MAG: polysaccharide biosynthesis protein [Candidatus Beckwithbacteria bacterium GW2011_GWC1_49_16]KKU35747.1 MAG: Polysaccharide biosynthesis protein [Candidatus Beckwithbacteria bacterium GW2011_GWA1_46_30]KKU61001.1 MAG: Polysaccharide biosynthesis protein [Candidatus Beckwithbacteria bacterium GW2011_GWB1_47_15]KKU72306.1 MAG: Polysaccharide biosynthesis protein [Candidatus Beckwithbacteria bacterium GW2011_GWA2_47_25]KKW04934.1 MAG: Polysaccharide biosynthesis protein [Candidatus Beckwit
MSQEIFESQSELTPEVIAHRAVSGVMVLTLRKFALRAVSYLGSIFLARLLTPEIFGVFAIVNFIITFFAFFSDVGLGAALIQKKDKLNQKDLAVTFTLQQLFVVLTVVAIFLSAPFFAAKYNLGSDGAWLIRIFSLSLFLTSLKTIPSILLERRLQFGRLVIPEVIEVISFQFIAVGMAWAGYGVWSFIVGLLIRSLLGTITLYLISPWKISFAWDRTRARKLISFGVPFQLNGFIATIKDAVMPIFVGAVSGATAVGYLNWALTFSKLPILFMSDIFRVTFPTYSRIQHDKKLLGSAIEKTIRFTNLFLFPAVFLLAAAARPIVSLIFTDKWLPALPAFYVHLFGILVVGVANTFMDSFWAMGKTKIAIKLLIIFTLINWGTSVPLVYAYGFIGAMVGSVIVLYVSLPLTWYYIKTIVPVTVTRNIAPFFAAATIAGFVTAKLAPLAQSLFSLSLVLFAGGLVYLGLLLVFDRRQLTADYHWFLTKIRK